MTVLTMSMVLWALATPLQGPTDPAGDLPPTLEPATTTTVTTMTTAPPPSPTVTVVVLPMIGLGVDDELRVRAGRSLALGLASRAIVVDGARLPAATQAALASCESFRCTEHLDPLGADVVVTASLGPIGGDVVLTVRLRSVKTVQRLQVQGPAADLDALTARAVTALPLDPGASSTSGPTAKMPDEQAPPSKSKSKAGSSSSSSSTVKAGTSPPEVMILVYFALALVPVAGSPLILPLVQGFVAEQVGPELVGLEYKSWGTAVLAGYATYLIGGTLGIGTYVTGAVIASTGNTQVGVALVAAGGLTLLATAIAEPVVFHLVSSMSAVPLGADGE